MMFRDMFIAFCFRILSRLVSRRIYQEKPILDELLGDTMVKAELRRAWYESNPHATEVPSDQPGSRKREQGGWIIWNEQTGRVAVLRVPAGTRDRLATMAGTRPPDESGKVAA